MITKRRASGATVRGLAVAAGVLVAATGCGDGNGPSADAGDDMTVSVGEAPVFDGCGSTGDIVNYEWTIREAPPTRGADVGKMIRETMSDCSFTLESAMVVDEVGTWTVELSVSDGAGTESTDTVDVVVEE